VRLVRSIRERGLDVGLLIILILGFFYTALVTAWSWLVGESFSKRTRGQRSVAVAMMVGWFAIMTVVGIAGLGTLVEYTEAAEPGGESLLLLAAGAGTALLWFLVVVGVPKVTFMLLPIHGETARRGDG